MPPVSAPRMVELIRAAGTEHCIVSSDCGVYLLPPPHEGLREFLLLLESCGLARAELRCMTITNPATLFGIAVP